MFDAIADGTSKYKASVDGSGDYKNPNGTLLPYTAAGDAGNPTGSVELGINATTRLIGGAHLSAGSCAMNTAAIRGGTAGILPSPAKATDRSSGATSLSHCPSDDDKLNHYHGRSLRD